MKSASGFAAVIISASTCQSCEVALALLVLGLEAHAGPDVGGDQVGAAAASIGSANDFAVRAVHAGALGSTS